jgi:hypothetical protein
MCNLQGANRNDRENAIFYWIVQNLIELQSFTE